MVLMALGNLAWEFAHMPLYTLWETGTRGEIIFAALHCTGGDILIALAALMAALFLFGNGFWPAQTYRRIAVATIAIGLAYTLFSEWLNIEIRAAWAYRDLMPVIPFVRCRPLAGRSVGRLARPGLLVAGANDKKTLRTLGRADDCRPHHESGGWCFDVG